MDVSGVIDSYRRMVAEAGEPVWLRRYSGTGASRTGYDYGPVMARVTGYMPHELVGNVKQGDRKVVMMADEVEPAGFPLPFQPADKLVLRLGALDEKELNIEFADDSTRRVGGVLVAYELRAAG